MKLILSCLLLAVFTTSAYSQKAIKPKTTGEVVEALCHTWTATALQSAGMKLPLPLKTEILQLTVKMTGHLCVLTKRERQAVNGPTIPRSCSCCSRIIPEAKLSWWNIFQGRRN